MEGNYGKIDKNILEEELEKIGNFSYNTEKNLWKVISDEYEFEIDSTGKVVDITGKIEYTQDKASVTDGKNTYNVGDDYIDYTCDLNVYDGGWKILGAENGALLIMSAQDIDISNDDDLLSTEKSDYISISDNKLMLKGSDGYNNGVAILNNICIRKFGENARSIKVEDINRITGYDPNSDGKGEKYGQGNDWEYGTVNQNDSTIKSTYYKYYPYSLTTSNSKDGECIGIESTSLVYKMLFGESDSDNDYWLASKHAKNVYGNWNYGLRLVSNDDNDGMCVHGEHLIVGSGTGSGTHGVRVVISVKGN